MSIDDVLKLVNAGYTREEIDKMQQTPGNDQGHDQSNDQGNNQGHDQSNDQGNNQGHDQSNDQGNNQGNNQGNDQSNDQGSNQELEQLRQELTQTQTELKNLVKQMQSNNLKTASVNIVPDADLEKKTDAALAELIRPTIKKED